MANAAELVIKVTTDTKDAQGGLDEVSSRSGKMASGIQKAALPAAAALLAIGGAAMKTVDAASKTQQAYGALDSIFGSNAAQMKAWAEAAAESTGLAKSEYAELASVLGAQLKNAGVPMDQLGKKTDALIRQGADMAAMFGGTTAEAVQALSSALKGETDPIERYGVAVKQADIAARMAADGTDELTGAAAKQAKTTALLALVNEQTADAVGTFAKEQDSAAGSAQIAAAQYENMKSELGTALLPVVAMVSDAMGSLAKIVGNNSKATQILVGIIGGLALAVLAINAAMKVYQATLLVVQVVQKATWLAALGPIGLVIVAVGAVIAIVMVLWHRSETFRTIVLGVWNAIRTAATNVASAVASAWHNTMDALVSAAKWAQGVVSGIFAGIRGAWDNVMGAIRGAVGGLGALLAGPFQVMKGAIDAVVGAVMNLIHWLGNIKVPKISLPSIPNPFSLPGAAPALAGVGAAPRVARTPSPRAGATSTGPTFIINGAIDPEATARQIQRILAGHNRRMGVSP